MATINKVNNNTTHAVQRYMEVRMTANGVGAVRASSGGAGMGDATSNPFPSIYYYETFTGYKSGASERKRPLPGIVFPEKVFHVDPSIAHPISVSFQSERMKNVGQYEKNYVASYRDPSIIIEGDA